MIKNNNFLLFNNSLVLGYYFFAIIKKYQKKEAENKQNWNIHINKFLQLKQNKSIIKQIFIIPIFMCTRIHLLIPIEGLL